MELLLNKYIFVDLMKVQSFALEAFAIEDGAFLLRVSAGKAGYCWIYSSPQASIQNDCKCLSPSLTIHTHFYRIKQTQERKSMIKGYSRFFCCNLKALNSAAQICPYALPFPVCLSM